VGGGGGGKEERRPCSLLHQAPQHGYIAVIPHPHMLSNLVLSSSTPPLSMSWWPGWAAAARSRSIDTYLLMHVVYWS